MKNRLGKLLLVSLAALSIASVGVASAKPDSNPGRGHGAQEGKGQNGKGPEKKGQQYTFHGTYAGTEGLAAGQISIVVSKGNRWVKRSGLIGQTVVFDVSSARIKVADVNTDGTADLADVTVGDAVMIQARLPRTLPLTQPLNAWKLVDKTNPPVTDGSEGTEVPG